MSATAPIKAPDAFRTISEVAGDLDLPQHVLRFWETRFTQIKPMKRGGGRRYYRPEDVNLLRGIRLLLYSEGYTIRGVQRLLKEKSAAFVAAYGEGGADAAMMLVGDQAIAPAAEREEAVETPARVDAPPLKAGPRSPQGRAKATTPPEQPPAPQAGTRAAPPPRSNAPLAVANRRRIEGVLAELVEAKRLLDQAR